MLPLNGASAWVSKASRQGRLRAMAPQYSMLARVVSKWLLLGMMSPGLSTHAARIPSAARPWWVGKMCSIPVISETLASKRFHDRLPA